MNSKKEKPEVDPENKRKKIKTKSVTLNPSSVTYSPTFDVSNLIVVGVIKADEHSRLTFTKRVKSVFPVFPGNTIVIYQNPINNELLFKVQHNNVVTDTWIVKKKTDYVTTPILKTNLRKKDISNLEQNLKITNKKNQRPKSNANIMIIDDDEESLDTFKSLLQDFTDNDVPKLNVDTFNLGSNAIKKYLDSDYSNKDSSSYYDLIILDVKMPEINGIQLYQIFRLIDLDVKVLFVSGLDTTGDLVGILPGIKPEDVLKKPFDADPFILKVKEKLLLDIF